jgi:hypothetical protein
MDTFETYQEATSRRGERDLAKTGQTGGRKVAGERRRRQAAVRRRERVGGRGWATAQPTPSSSVLSETRRGGLSGPKGGG